MHDKLEDNSDRMEPTHSATFWSHKSVRPGCRCSPGCTQYQAIPTRRWAAQAAMGDLYAATRRVIRIEDAGQIQGHFAIQMGAGKCLERQCTNDYRLNT